MTEEEMRKHALLIAKNVLMDVDYSYVYEDETLEDATEEELKRIHDIVTREVTVALP